MASNAAFVDETHRDQPSAMSRPAGSGFGADKYEELSDIERRENVKASGAGTRGRVSIKDQSRYWKDVIYNVNDKRCPSKRTF